MVKIHGLPFSTCTTRVMACCHEKEVEFELIPVNLMAGAHKQKPHLDLNPFGQIPALQDGDLTLFDFTGDNQFHQTHLTNLRSSHAWGHLPFGQIPALQDGDLTLFESRAITRYVSKKQQGKGSDLLGSTLAEQAMVDVWCEVEAHQFSVPSSAIVVQCVIIPMREGKTDEEVVKTNMEKLNKVLDVYEERLAKHNYLAGDFFSLADLHHLSYIHYLVHVVGKGEIISIRPNVNSWWERISARPAWQKVTQIMKR